MGFLEKAVSNGTALYIPEYVDNQPSNWDNFISFIDYCNKQGVESTPEERKAFAESGRVRIGNLQIWGYFTTFAENPVEQEQFFPTLKSIAEKASKDYNGARWRSSFALTNISNAENVTNRHNDRTHNLYIQCIGSVTWKIYKALDSAEYSEYTLKPGDAIWVPAGVSHEVVALEPRAAVTIAFHGLDDD